MNQKIILTIASIAVIIAVALIVGGFYKISGSRAEEIILGPKDNGRILNVSIGTVVIIKLPENPSTGCRWQYTVNENIEELIENIYIPPENQIPGRGGTRMLKLVVMGSGKFTMDYGQPWENNSVNNFSVSFLCG